jgi:hypothetical protein
MALHNELKCSVCEKSTEFQASILEALLWREPIESIAEFYSALPDDVLSHSGVENVPDSFPFFERSDFLFGRSTFGALVARLPRIAARVETAARPSDHSFCLIVRSVCDYFGGNGHSTLLKYARVFDLVAREANCVELPEDRNFVRSVQRLDEVRRGWLLEHPDRDRIRIYGHGAVAISQIARFAFKGDGKFVFDETAQTQWALRQFFAFFSWRWFLGPWMKQLRQRNPSRADRSYWMMRIAGVPFVTQETALAPDTQAEKDAFRSLRKQLHGIVIKRSKSSRWQATLNTERPRPDGSLRFSEELADVEMPFAIAKALAEDRARTPEGGWWEHLVKEMLDGKAIPIVTRVDRDLVDVLRARKPHEIHLNGTGGQFTILDTRCGTNPDEFAKTDARLTIEKIGQSVCHTPLERAIWQGNVEGKTLHKMSKELGFSKSRVDQIWKDLLTKARKISYGRRLKTKIHWKVSSQRRF